MDRGAAMIALPSHRSISVVGDLFEACLKRHAGMKLERPHSRPGGMLERIDSLLAALPVFVVARELLL